MIALPVDTGGATLFCGHPFSVFPSPPKLGDWGLNVCVYTLLFSFLFLCYVLGDPDRVDTLWCICCPRIICSAG